MVIDGYVYSFYDFYDQLDEIIIIICLAVMQTSPIFTVEKHYMYNKSKLISENYSLVIIKA